jgi:hypothetical protein
VSKCEHLPDPTVGILLPVYRYTGIQIYGSTDLQIYRYSCPLLRESEGVRKYEDFLGFGDATPTPRGEVP